MKFEEGLIGDFYGVDNHCFKINDTVYEVLEDESDGYRSMMQGIYEVRDTGGLIFYRIPFAKVKVREIKTYSENSYDRVDGYELYDEESDHVWLTFGTSNYDDYYPCFMFNYQTLEDSFRYSMEK